MIKFFTNQVRFFLIISILCMGMGIPMRGQISFSQNQLNLNGFTSITNGTALEFGPDGRLYVVDYRGLIKVFTILRNGPGNYQVAASEDLTGVTSIQDHNDDGSPFSSPNRETLGIAVGGTEQNPVVYVASSDFRIG